MGQGTMNSMLDMLYAIMIVYITNHNKLGDRRNGSGAGCYFWPICQEHDGSQQFQNASSFRYNVFKHKHDISNLSNFPLGPFVTFERAKGPKVAKGDITFEGKVI